jgi:hypothetical protein
MKNLGQVLSLLEENKFYAKISKYTFDKEEVDYLGHIISKKGVKVDPMKIRAITEWPRPKNISKLRGLVGYYQRFVNNYSHLMPPLTNILKKNYFQWNLEAHKCFENLKNIMSTTPILAILELSKSFIIECDVLGFGIRAILMQDGHPIDFKSKKLNKT